jgi:hypothetical protein
MGRRVYWAGIILVVMALKQRATSTIELMGKFNIQRKTLYRWIKYFREEFTRSSIWQRLRGRVSSLVSNRGLPGTLLDYFIRHHASSRQGLIACLCFLATG